MSKQAAANGSGIVTSDSLKRRLSLVQWAMFGAVLLVLVGGGVSFYGYQFAHWWGPAAVARHLNIVPPVPTPAQQLASAQRALQAAKTANAQAQAYSQLGSAYLAANQPKAAAAAYNQALRTTSDKFAVLSGLSSAYELSGQNALAIKALQQMVDLLNKSSNPEDQALARRIQNHIIDLGGHTS